MPHTASKHCPEYTSPPTSPYTYYYQLAGYSSSESFILQIIQQVISMIGNAISWFLVEWVGRRPLMFYGLCSLTVDLILTDAVEVVATPTALKGKPKIPTQI
jgi:SP family general alpha glucoside:H+ symporter-like MFS transporter